ncbi:MAG TPA: biopolymer transporter ExbD [Alcanivorax sp.]|uniref:Biopolymer transport protein ExbD/TolR n=1 Tax=Alcanivorax jadensis T9 TaxID=1177181 RepID=A0ABR4WHI5_9GAMM|nr:MULTISPECIES: biopolymer transporter ExbD [Alcanivorax]MAC16100.1 biopolymer transporter ExbD [Alcanivorax sp.]KGD63063.1 biopolymer transport protein ExbD/TolR [Alcanivorax jadensis T9]MBG33481.1 biopolymer transporter ExbD [Alcanivorax sp.]MBP21035.1 biopolymer transporter ExbD [Alcanivorax sp.]MDF1636533.1 biopolymer transporter ExbD [Alcanivorax jadensis]
MKKSARARRMARHHGRHKMVATLNLTSLMDIFTILLIFLLVNNNNAAKLPEDQDIQLPESTAQELPNDVLIIQVSATNVIIDGRKIADTQAVKVQEERTVDALVEELKFRASRALAVNPEDEREVMIQADRDVPYAVIKKLMRSCMETPYTKVAFAVLKVAEEESE